MSETLPRLDKQAVYERIDELCSAIDLVVCSASAAFELVEGGMSLPHRERKQRDLSCILIVEVLAQRAKAMCEDLLNNPPTLQDSPETANVGESSNGRRGTL